ncbi:hypothetical protein [Aquabacterium humicola]|uniref:hypothetical protein n=1 Tax=Aquabacterium humicola TaxID=3237377 RepID=UPI002542B325|nr:hypothetical protein [Rubrivivax pictus]
MSKSLYGYYGPFAAPSGGVLRRSAAFALRGASKALAKLSRRLRADDVGRGAQRAPELEFYAEAGAPEGALYVNGEYVGHVSGVRRL